MRIHKEFQREYNSFRKMKERCYNKNEISYPNYGGRGITVCERWCSKNGFRKFLEDMGERPKGKTLDRFPDTNGNYEPGNVRWATKFEQSWNIRPKPGNISGESFIHKRSTNGYTYFKVKIEKAFLTIEEAIKFRDNISKILKEVEDA